jgi:hypothetical protein
MAVATERRPEHLRITCAPVHDGLLGEHAALSGAASMGLERVLVDPSTIPAISVMQVTNSLSYTA